MSENGGKAPATLQEEDDKGFKFFTESDKVTPPIEVLDITAIPQDRAAKKIKTEEDGCGSIIAAHYNTEEKGLEARASSRIHHMRNFNNWVKVTLLDEFSNRLLDVKKKFGFRMKAFDMCCGKGGDLFKWKGLRISYLVAADIAEMAIENCKKRYENFGGGSIFSAQFIVADLTKTRVRSKFTDPSIKFDLVSCQFAFHYSFESLPQAEMMLQNASECLSPGGYFIGTMPNSDAIVSHLKNSGTNSFGNSIFRITYDDMPDTFPLFGAKYNFSLEGVVNCPEFLVYFPLFVKLAKKYDLELVKQCTVPEFYEENKSNSGFLRRMTAFETYPSPNLVTDDASEYEHCDSYLKENTRYDRAGTLTKSEWEAISIYMVFAFKKLPPKD